MFRDILETLAVLMIAVVVVAALVACAYPAGSTPTEYVWRVEQLDTVPLSPMCDSRSVTLVGFDVPAGAIEAGKHYRVRFTPVAEPPRSKR